MRDFGRLVLADASVFVGQCLYESESPVCGELVFSTATTGYTEIVSDPSYFGQILVLANPEIGNYGVNFADQQSDGIKVKALVVRNLSLRASSYRSQMTLADWFLREGVPIFYGIDTRFLIEHIRTNGSMMAALSLQKYASTAALFKEAQLALAMKGRRLSTQVCVKSIEIWHDGLAKKNAKHRVVVLDFGVKREILRYLSDHFAEVIIVPGHSSAEDIWAQKPDGVFLSNGPGDPQSESQAVKVVRSLLGKIPIFGVCLGHQILAQALAQPTYKMKFGHRGSNQPVKDSQGKILITAQNHGFAVDMHNEAKLLGEDINISDGSNEGLEVKDLCAFSVQFHPEGAPGPHDATFYFDKFRANIDNWQKNKQRDLLKTTRLEQSESTMISEL